jgi:glycerol kinase
MVRAVLEGVAHRGADLLDAARVQSGKEISEIRVDGGMSVNTYFTQFLADITSTRVCVSDEREATLRGAGLMALVGICELSVEEVGQMTNYARIHEPQVDADLASLVRFEWASMVERSEKTIPGLSSISF